MKTILVKCLIAFMMSSTLGSTLSSDNNEPKDFKLLEFPSSKHLTYPSSNEDSVIKNLSFYKGPDGKIHKIRFHSLYKNNLGSLIDDNYKVKKPIFAGLYRSWKKSLQDTERIRRIPPISSRFADDPIISPKLREKNEPEILIIPRFAKITRNDHLTEVDGVRRKTLDNNRQIERIPFPTALRVEVENSADLELKRRLSDPEKQDLDVIKPLIVFEEQSQPRRRSRRLVEAYGTPKKFFSNNGQIERFRPEPLPKAEGSQRPKNFRMTRSIDAQSKNESQDLEGQDAKVFRPLFVYRQQVAARQRRLQSKKKTKFVSNYSPQLKRKPYVEWKPYH